MLDESYLFVAAKLIPSPWSEGYAEEAMHYSKGKIVLFGRADPTLPKRELTIIAQTGGLYLCCLLFLISSLS